MKPLAPGDVGFFCFPDSPRQGQDGVSALQHTLRCPRPSSVRGPLPSSGFSFSGVALRVMTSPSPQACSHSGTQKAPLNPSAFWSRLPDRCPRGLLSGSLSVLVCIWALGAPQPLRTGPLRTGPLSGKVPSGKVPSQDWSPQDGSPLRKGPLRTGPPSGLVPSGLGPLSTGLSGLVLRV